MIRTSTRECPNCNHTIQIDPGYPVWCDRCDWNLDVPEFVRVRNRPQKVFHEMGRRISDRLLKIVLEDRPAPPTFTPPRVAAVAIAGIIHLCVLAVAIAGVVMLVEQQNSFTTLVGVVLVAVAVAMRPRVMTVPNLNYLPREHFPRHYELADRIASVLNTKRVEAIFVTADFNAFFFRAGWQRRNFICLGIPLVEVLTPQERVALIAHELGHSANGDASRGFFVGSAIRSLDTWHGRYEPDDEIDAMSLGLSAMLLGTPWLLVRLLRLVSGVLVLLLANDSQRGEYLSDSMGARAGGTQAMVSTLHKLHMEDALDLAMSRFYELGKKQGVLEVLRQRIERVPPREIERVARIEKLVDSRLDASHPPTAYRIQVLEAWPVEEPQVVLSDEDIAALDAELAPITSELEDMMLQAYRDRINY